MESVFRLIRVEFKLLLFKAKTMLIVRHCADLHVACHTSLKNT